MPLLQLEKSLQYLKKSKLTKPSDDNNVLYKAPV
ncbi:hypothetical protein GBAR_LOCUS31276, partial [Geodia barretti]